MISGFCSRNMYLSARTKKILNWEAKIVVYTSTRIIVLLARHHLPSVITALRLAADPSQLTEGDKPILSGHAIGRTETFAAFSCPPYFCE